MAAHPSENVGASDRPSWRTPSIIIRWHLVRPPVGDGERPMKKTKLASFVAAVLLIFSPLSASKAGPDNQLEALRARTAARALTQEQFTDCFAELVRLRDKGAKVTVEGPLQVKIRFADHSDCMSYLDNPWRRGKDDPSSRFDALLAQLKALEETKKTGEAANEINNLIPLIKDAEYVKNANGMMSSAPVPQKLACEPLFGDLYLVYAFDRPESMQMANTSILSQYKLSGNAARQRAWSNFTRTHGLPRIESDNGIHYLVGDGTTESSWLLDDKFWNAQAKLCKSGRLSAMVPARDAVFFVEGNDRAAVDRMRSAALRIFDRGDHVISKMLFAWNGGKWTVINQ